MARGNGATVADVTVSGTTFKRGRRRRPDGIVFGPPRFVADNEQLYPLTDSKLALLRQFYTGNDKAYPAVVSSQAELDAALALPDAMPICMSTDVDLRFQIRPGCEGAKRKTVFVGGACEADAYEGMTACALDISEVVLHDALGHAHDTGCLHVRDGSRAVLHDRAVIERTEGDVEIELHDYSTAIVDSGAAVVVARDHSTVLAEKATLVVLENQAQLQPTTIRADDGGRRESKVRKVVMNGCSRLGPIDKGFVEVKEPWCMIEQVPVTVRFDPAWKSDPLVAESLSRVSRTLTKEGRLPYVDELPPRTACVYCGKQTTNANLVAYRFGVCADCSRAQ